jgi:alpha-beta hydrolase superfamily lysophospholipase
MSLLYLAAFSLCSGLLPPMTRITTSNGTAFGVVLYPRPLNNAKAPHLVVALTGALNDTLGCDEASTGDKCYYSNVCQVLVTRVGSSGNWACASLDLPSHGDYVEQDEPEGIQGWQWRLDRGQNFVEQSNVRIKDMLAYLKESEVLGVQIDTSDIVVTGISRGGFLASHYAATDARVRTIALFSPVTNLSLLTEFEPDLTNATHQAKVLRPLDLATPTTAAALSNRQEQNYLQSCVN